MLILVWLTPLLGGNIRAICVTPDVQTLNNQLVMQCQELWMVSWVNTAALAHSQDLANSGRCIS